MTDEDLVRKKLAFIETCVRELRSLASPALVGVDVRETRFVEHTLQIAIQAAQDIASHIVAAQRLGEPRTNAALFDLLAGDGWISRELAGRLRAMVGFRNVLVHGYVEVDPGVLLDVLAHRLPDFLGYVDEVRQRLDAGLPTA